MVFLILFMQPGIISMLVSSISCRVIAGTGYILADVSLKCYTDDYYRSYALVLPSLLIWGFLIPYLLYKFVKDNEKNLNTIFL
jgi:hypothetical protein